MTMASKSLKILFYPIDGIGHQNGCIGLAQAMAKRGHQVIFFSNIMFKGKYEKLGFREIVLHSEYKIRNMTKKDDGGSQDHPLQIVNNLVNQLRDMGFLADVSPMEKLEMMSQRMFDDMMEELMDIHPQIADAIEQEKPDLMIVDHIMHVPCIAYGKIPWISLCSGAPLMIFDSPDFPPISSGYPSYDQTGWDEFRQKSQDTLLKACMEQQNKLNKHLGFPEINPETFKVYRSPYLTIYGYPKELDFYDDHSRPKDLIQVDTFCRESSESFELPDEFKAKMKPGDKLVYLTLGSMGAMDVELMRRVVNALSKSPHKFIVSKGSRHEEIQLPDNMWGKAFLPQIKVLPLVDLVITHGGNNTVTETMKFGKPMLVMPLFGDQFDNAQRVMEKGYGERFPSAYRFDDVQLVGMVDRLLADNEMRQRCRLAGERIRGGNSKQKACEKIEEYLTKLSAKKSG